MTNCQISAKLSFIYSNYIQIKLDFDFIMTLTVLPLSVAENVDTEKDLLECVCVYYCRTYYKAVRVRRGG